MDHALASLVLGKETRLRRCHLRTLQQDCLPNSGLHRAYYRRHDGAGPSETFVGPVYESARALQLLFLTHDDLLPDVLHRPCVGP